MRGRVREPCYAAAADVAAVHALVERAYRGDAARLGWTHEADLLGGQRTDPVALAALIADATHRLILLGDGLSPIGCVDVHASRTGIACLGLLAVEPARQAEGFGKTLIEAAEACAAVEFGAAQIEMTVIAQRPELIAYYERRGYRRTGERRPFPLDDARFGLPTIRALVFEVLAKQL